MAGRILEVHGRRVGYWLEDGMGRQEAALVPSISFSPSTCGRDSVPSSRTLQKEDLGTARNQGKPRVPSHLFCEAAA